MQRDAFETFFLGRKSASPGRAADKTSASAASSPSYGRGGSEGGGLVDMQELRQVGHEMIMMLLPLFSPFVTYRAAGQRSSYHPRP